MSLTLGAVITAIRDLHPAFDKTRVPDTVLASALSDYQNQLIGRAVEREKTFLSQTLAIAVQAGQTVAPEGGSFVDLGENGVPFLSTRSGYLVEVNDNGVPFIASSTPLLVSVDQGIDLPVLLAVIGGTVRFTDGQDEHLCITSYAQRFHPPHFPAVYLIGTTVYLVGTREDWNEVASIELRFAPVAPALTRLTDTFLMPDQARPALVAYGALCAAKRAEAWSQGGTGPKPDVQLFLAEADRAEDRYLSTFRLSKRARVTTRRNPEDLY